jgi:fucose 4-O-acetylase-like acetyltransferase
MIIVKVTNHSLKEFLSDKGRPFGLTEPARVDTLRAVACLLLVFWHVSNDVAAFSRTRLEEIAFWNEVLSVLRMPLFSFLSGLLYAGRPAEAGRRLAFGTGKAYRLLGPFLALTTLLVAMKALYPGASVPVGLRDLPHYLVYGYSHLWFLQALFLIFLLFLAVDPFLRNKGVGYAFLFGLATLLHFTPAARVEVLSVDGAVYLLPFFALGALVRVHAGLIGRWRGGLALGLGILAGLLLSAVGARVGAGTLEKVSALALAASVSTLLAVFLVMPANALLARIGGYSFAIYLFHSIFTALALRLVPGDPTMLPLVLAAALLGPIAVEVAIRTRLPAFGWVIGIPRSRLSAAGAGPSGRLLRAEGAGR